jgi:hypothetical protein
VASAARSRELMARAQQERQVAVDRRAEAAARRG